MVKSNFHHHISSTAEITENSSSAGMLDSEVSRKADKEELRSITKRGVDRILSMIRRVDYLITKRKSMRDELVKTKQLLIRHLIVREMIKKTKDLYKRQIALRSGSNVIRRRGSRNNSVLSKTVKSGDIFGNMESLKALLPDITCKRQTALDSGSNVMRRRVPRNNSVLSKTVKNGDVLENMESLKAALPDITNKSIPSNHEEQMDTGSSEKMLFLSSSSVTSLLRC